MSEKNCATSRLLLCLISISMFFLILSSLFLLQFRDSSIIPGSVINLIIVNNTSPFIERSITSKSPIVSSKPHKTQKTFLNISNPHKEISALPKTKKCDLKNALICVYMYDLPIEFHFGLLGWKGNGNQLWPNINIPDQIPSYPGGLNLQHSIEYWLTLDLLSSNGSDSDRSCSAFRVHDPRQADIIFVPFFSSLSYNRFSKLHGNEKVSLNTVLQNKIVRYLKGRDEWKRFGGKNHLIVAHHPNSMLTARKKLSPAMFILADFGRYSEEIANLKKDVIAPYKHLVKTIRADMSPKFEDRPILVYFQGAIYRKDGGAIRQELYYLLKDEKDVHFTFGSIKSNGVKQAGRGMSSSKFCLNIAGDTPSSNRLFDAIASHCVPVIISDEIELPYEDILDYSEFCIFIKASNAVKKGLLLKLLRGIDRDQWTKMWERLKQVVRHFEYQYPSRSGDAVDMTWQAVSRKVYSIQSSVHRNNRYTRYRQFIKVS